MWWRWRSHPLLYLRGTGCLGEWLLGGDGLTVLCGSCLCTESRSKSMRAKGTLISEPRFSTPCEMRFFPCEKGKTAFSKKIPRQRPPLARCDFSHARKGKRPFQRKSLDKGRFPFLAWENRISQGVENRGSLISVPLALRGGGVQSERLSLSFGCFYQRKFL